MLESILDAILDPRPEASRDENQKAPSDPVSWIDDVFGDGWMASWPFVDTTNFDHMSMYGCSLDSELFNQPALQQQYRR